MTDDGRSRTLPLRCHECGIEKGYPCSFLDQHFEAMHGETRADVCAVEQAHAAGFVVALVPHDASPSQPRTTAAEVIVWGEGRVSFILNNREFEVVVVPTLVDSMGQQAAAEATADTLRRALLHD